MRISFLHPVHQFNGSIRLLSELQSAFMSSEFTEFHLAVAFAKSGPLFKMQGALREWRQQGNLSKGIFGIDHFGTSLQALQLALELFDEVYVTHTGGACTFHPKLYFFRGPQTARMHCGSHNLTTGGLETNLEASICINFDFPADIITFDNAFDGWKSLLPSNFAATKVLNLSLLSELVDAGLVLDETVARAVTLLKPTRPESEDTRIVLPPRKPNPFLRLRPKPASSRPASARRSTPCPALGRPRPSASSNTTPTISVPATPSIPLLAAAGSDILVMQIKAHHNGEVFLSKRAVEQNPAFFGFPFTGKSTPKRGANQPYPHREPAPIVNITIFGTQGNKVHERENFVLTTVSYEEKSEIRVTVSPDLRDNINEYAIMVMSQSDTLGVDYDIEIYNPGSSLYDDYLAVCDQTMPGGGQVARKFGWL